jgi:hypothetical protein
VCRYLRGGKSGRSAFALLGYSVDALRLHLEAHFSPGMGWHNRGEWHIDHIRPLSSFHFSGPNDPAIREAWALSNLQPMWARDNIRKSNRWSRLTFQEAVFAEDVAPQSKETSWVEVPKRAA